MNKKLIINIVGSNTVGYVGERADELLIADSLRVMGHFVNFVPRDIWKGYVDGQEPNSDWVLPVKADVNIICKWNAFDHPKYAAELYLMSGNSPVLYWVWDFMQGEEWHMQMVDACDMYLSNDVFSGRYKNVPHARYFPYDVADGDLIGLANYEKEHDVVFFGSYMGQGDRVEWITEINKTHPVKVFSWNYKEWEKIGLESHPAVYGQEFVEELDRSKIVLGFNVDDHTWGYWSNRVGKVLTQGGLLLQRYVPGMELFLRDGAEYFNSIEEANQKIELLLEHPEYCDEIRERAFSVGQERFTVDARIKDLLTIIYEEIL